jgi:hypothetical protein
VQTNLQRLQAATAEGQSVLPRIPCKLGPSEKGPRVLSLPLHPGSDEAVSRAREQLDENALCSKPAIGPSARMSTSVRSVTTCRTAHNLSKAALQVTSSLTWAG